MNSTSVTVPSRAEDRIELRNGRFVDVVRGRYLEPGTRLQLAAGRIVAVAPPAAELPAAAEVIDLQGKAVLPALTNAHAHVQLTLPSLLASPRETFRSRLLASRQIELALGDCRDRGITTVHDALTHDLGRNRALAAGAAQRAGGPRLRQAVLVAPLGGPFSPARGFGERLLYAAAGLPWIEYDDARSGVVTFAPDASPEVVRAAVDRAIDERRADVIKLYDQREHMLSYAPGALLMSQRQLDAACDQARRRGRATAMHHLTVESFRRGVSAGVNGLVHLPSDKRLSRDDVQAFVRSGCVLVPTVSIGLMLCWERPSCLPAQHPAMRALADHRNEGSRELASFWLPELRESFLAGLGKAERGTTRLFGVMDMAKVFRYYAGIITCGIDNLAALLEAGAPVALGNDAGAVPCTPAMVGLELELIGRLAGSHRHFCAIDALRAATWHAAEALGMRGEHGSLEVGKVADLAVVDGDPLSDRTVLGRPVAALFFEGALGLDRAGLRPAPRAA